MSFVTCLQAQQVREAVKLAHIRDRPIMEGTINNKKAYFLLDTGASISILHSKAAKKYGFTEASYQYSDAHQVISFSGEISHLAHARSVEIHLGDQNIKTPFFIEDFSAVVENTRNRTSIEIAGIIGSDVMRMYGFQIDYLNREVSFRQRKKVTSKEAPIASKEE